MINPDINSKSILKNTLFSFLSKFLPLLISIVSIPILIRNIGEEKFGVLALFWAFIGYFNFFDLGLGKALTNSISNKLSSRESLEISSLFSTASTLSMSFGCLAGFIFFLISEPLLLNFFNIDIELYQEISNGLIYLSIGIPFVIISSSLRGTLEAYHAFKELTNTQILIAVLTYSGLIIISYYDNVSYLIGWLSLQKIFISLFFYLHIKKHLKLRYSISSFKAIHAKYLFTFGGWVTISSIVSPLIETMDRLIIGAQKTMSSLAFYSVPIDLIKRLGILPSSISLVIFPIFSRANSDKDPPKNILYNTSFEAVLFLGSMLVFFLISLSKEILAIWLTPEFSENAHLLLQIIAIGGLFNFLARIPLSIIQGSGKPNISAKFHLFELPVYLLALILLIHFYGLPGAAIAASLRMTIDFLLLHSYAVKNNGVEAKIIHLIIGALVPLSIAFYVSTLNNMGLKLTLVVLGLISIVALFWFYIFNKKIKNLIISSING